MTKSSLRNRLDRARQRRFVGRSAERALFEAALKADALPFYVLYMYGPGGVGKTTLLREYQTHCDGAEVCCALVNLREVDAVPSELERTVKEALAKCGDRRAVLLLDNFEAMTPIEDWIRESWLPTLPEDTMVVLASRRPPSLSWRSDEAWQTLIRALPLRNFCPEESIEYLNRREFPAEHHKAVLDFTHGHPLALSLVVDAWQQNPQGRFSTEAIPDVIGSLLHQFMEEAPGVWHREALEACAMVRVTTEALLEVLLGPADATRPTAHALFEWMRSLSFMDADAQGVYPHDLAREVLSADLRWRHPDRYAELHRRARQYYSKRLQSSASDIQHRTLFDYIYLHRDNPAVRPFMEWKDQGAYWAEPMKESDIPRIVAAVERHEGAQAAERARYWIERQPQGVTVVRSSDGSCHGFIITVSLDSATEEDLEYDPAAGQARRFLQQKAPLRKKEVASLFRFWMDVERYQAVSAVQSVLFIQMVRHYLTTPSLAYTFLPCRDADFWAPILQYGNLSRICECDYDGMGVYGHDWRLVPPATWLSLMNDRELSNAPVEPLDPTTAPIVALSEPEFAQALRDALRDLWRTDALSRSVLLRSRMVVERTGEKAAPADAAAVLQTLIQEAAEQLRLSPRDEKFYRALDFTYLHPAPTQEQAAQWLDVPFSSFRRHLKTAMTRLHEILWNAELHGVAGRW